MPISNYNTLINFKYRFVTILNYLGGDNAMRAVLDIEKLPSQPLDGFHDAYLKSKLISITLTYMTEEEFNRFKNDSIRSNLLAALFGLSDVEEQADESIENVFLHCIKNPEESLEDCLTSLLGDSELVPFESFMDELGYLKVTCDNFINFYEKNKAELEMQVGHFPDTVSIETTHKGPQADDLQKTTFLSNPEEELVLVNQGSLIINNLRPCFGIVILAENQSNQSACSAYHHMPQFNGNEMDLKSLVLKIETLVQALITKDYTKHVRLFITGSNFASFPLALRVIMHCWNEPIINPGFITNAYLIPSPQGCWSYCLVKLVDGQCFIRAGSEFYNNDRVLCAERGIEFECSDFSGSDESSSFTSEESTEETIKEFADDTQKKQKRMRFFDSEIIDNSSENEAPTKKLKSDYGRS